MAAGYDLVVLGGGITGAGVLRDAVLRGLSCALVEAGASGGRTTLSSSGLIHGGLRYLPYDRATARLCSEEAGLLKRMAPGLLERRVFLWPAYGGRWPGLLLTESLLEGYDDLAPLKLGLPHVRLDAAEALEAEPQLERRGLAGAVSFDEWAVEPRRLVEANLESARRRGASVRLGARAAAFEVRGGRVTGVRVSAAGGDELVSARMVVNAAGPWAGEVASLAGVSSVRLRLRKGVHLVARNPGLACAVLLPGPKGRVIGAYPRGEEVWVGPTDEAFEGSPDEGRAGPEELAALAEAAVAVLPALPVAGARSAVGYRPILDQKGLAPFLSRDYRVFDHEALDGLGGLVTVTGGKMTAYRRMAEETADLVCLRLGVRAGSRSREPLEGEDGAQPPAPSASPRTLDGGAGRLACLLLSLSRLAYLLLRHLARAALGRRRRGLALFRETYAL